MIRSLFKMRKQQNGNGGAAAAPLSAEHNGHFHDIENNNNNTNSSSTNHNNNESLPLSNHHLHHHSGSSNSSSSTSRSSSRQSKKSAHNPSKGNKSTHETAVVTVDTVELGPNLDKDDDDDDEPGHENKLIVSVIPNGKHLAAINGIVAAVPAPPVEIVPEDLVNKRLPKELLIRVFSYLDIVSLCRCAQVSKYWNSLALDGSNWQHVDLFEFQTDVKGLVVENIAKRCGEFLKTLSLENCRWVTDDAIKKLSLSCKNIEVLNFKQCTKLTDNAFTSVGLHTHQLISLNLESCLINDEGLKTIARHCTNLEAVDISWCANLSSDAVCQLATSCAKLKVFSAKGLASINDTIVQCLTRHCNKSLIYLGLHTCIHLTDQALLSVPAHCPNLQFLSISRCAHLTDAVLMALGAHAHQLVILEASGCFNFSDAGFTALAKGCHALERVDLEECTRITDTTLVNLAVHCSNLKHLTLSRCECITDEGIKQLSASQCATVNETLQVLELDNCPLVTDAALEQLYACHSLAQLELYDCQLVTRNGIKKLQGKLPNVKVHAYFAPSVPAGAHRPARSCSCKCCTIL